MTIERGNWEASGRCRTAPASQVPDLFPENAVGVRVAKAFCKPCPAKTDCLEFALLRTEQFGVLGGESERERRKMLKARKNKS